MKEIQMDNWTRKEIYNHFSLLDYPFYSITLPIDVTNVKKVSKNKQVSFYHLMIWLCTKAINEVEEFNYRLIDNKLYCIDQSIPSFTDVKLGTNIFQFLTIPYQENYEKFHEDAKLTLENQQGLYGNAPVNEEVIYFSSLPWFDFTSLTNERNFNKDDMIPRISWGKYEEKEEKLFLHLSIDVNHRTIDGFHIAKFKENLGNYIKNLE